MRRAIAILLACAGCNAGVSGPPTGFGVNVTVDAAALNSATLATVAKGNLFVFGAETFETTFALAKEIKDGRLRFRYLPGVTQGTLGFYLEVIDAGGVVIAGGTSADVELVAGRAVEAMITLHTGEGNGSGCAAPDECLSGFCVDGLCCDRACIGVCESCSQAGSEGACTAIPDDSDPDHECLPASAPEDGGTVATDDAGEDVDAGDSDGGQAPVARVPDGGIVADPAKCVGVCNGQRACKFPSAQTRCGTPFCTFDDESMSLVCDGEGRCLPEPEKCVAYTCGPDSCKAQCTTHEDCLPTHFCDGLTQKCAPKKGNGVTCGTSTECQTNFCVPDPNGVQMPVCCNSECNGAGMSCHDTTGGNMLGMCKCAGVTCPAGVACQLYYYDGDRDTYGDKSAAGDSIKPACAGMNFFCTAAKADPAASPVPCTAANHRWEADRTDCRDDKPLVHPLQTGWFTAEIDPGSDNFDYNCSTAHEKETPEFPGGSCKFCEDDTGVIELSFAQPRTSHIGTINLCKFEDKCDRLGEYSALTCCSGRYSCGSSTFYGCEASVTRGFLANVNCGTTVALGGSYVECRTCLSAGGLAQSPNRPSKTQRCH